MPRSKERDPSSTSSGVQELAPWTLRPEVQGILRHIEDVSGQRIRIARDPSLTTWATVSIAESEATPHTIRYAPRYETHLAYLVAHECGHLLRLWSAPPETRLLPSIAKKQRRTAEHQLRKELPVPMWALSPAVLRDLLRIWHEGSVRQVSTYPADIRIEAWMFAKFPEMRAAQRTALIQQLRENELVLHPRVQSMTSKTAYQASAAMNCAFAQVAATLLDEPSLSGPYPDWVCRKAHKLVQELRSETDAGHLGDVAVSKRWSEVLGLSDWFKWIRLDAISNMNLSFI